jgi:WXG100 family type VII secretion target
MPADVNIKINTERMRAVAKEIENQMNIIKNCFDSIRSDAAALTPDNWQGASADLYSGSMKKLCSETPRADTVSSGYIVEALKAYANKLNKIASKYETTESAIHSRIDALPVKVFNV